MATSKGSAASSFHSQHSDDGSVLADIGHFEDIGLDDDRSTPKAANQNSTATARAASRSARSLARSPALSPASSPAPAPTGRTLAGAGKRPTPIPRRSFPNLRNSLYATNPRSTSIAGLTDPRPITLRKGHSTTSLPLAHRNRSVSPGISINTQDPTHPAYQGPHSHHSNHGHSGHQSRPRPRRGSWQDRDRKSITELERECDEHEADDSIPDGLVLDNVPLSPRPAHERPPSRAPSTSTSPDRGPKERVRSVGNGTPAVAQAQGSLRSPSWRSDLSHADRPPPSPLKARAHSWNAAHADLSAEARALTEKLEEHYDEVDEQQARRPSGAARPNTWNSTQTVHDYAYDRKERVKSSTPELPPLRRTNIMVDPLPVSKEKEAVLSRTRPSWLPPKDPAEERRHVKEYQKMMAASQRADERREAARRAKTTNRDSNADSLMQIWENDIIPRWQDAIRERRTRDLWWRGVAPRSRGTVWARAIGNELGLTPTSFEAALGRARAIEQRVKDGSADAEDTTKSKWFEDIRTDASDNTWKDLRIFQNGAPLHQALVDVLCAYAMYRVDTGYVSGCNVSAMRSSRLPKSKLTTI